TSRLRGYTKGGEAKLDCLPEGFIAGRQIRRFIQVSDTYLKQLADSRLLEYITTEGGHRRYAYKKYLRKTSEAVCETGKKRKIIYARVSSRSQIVELGNQIEYLRRRYPTHEIISDIGSGLNYKRKGFKTILESAICGDLEEVVVTFQDRFIRFGFDMFSFMFKRLSNAKIVVSRANDKSISSETELCEDLITVINVYRTRLHGRRSYASRRVRKSLQNAVSSTFPTERTDRKTVDIGTYPDSE